MMEHVSEDALLPAAATPREALDHLFNVTYEELRRLAAQVRRDERNETLSPTALVNEAYVKLAGSLRITPDSRLHFMRIAARAMRQVLVEAARRRGARKRGGDYAFVTLEEGLNADSTSPDELLALDSALEDLGRLSPRQAQLVEYRYFAGLDPGEIAVLLQISESTVLRDWRAAKAWLAHRLRRQP
jgi:RNA polymerase sigma factor (TIGR02999 family)